jgi:serine/threonine protein kinase/TolB-like protein/Flp pilus assembly protein TadD
MTLAAGEKLGPYEILTSVGKGGMGEVFRARDSRLNREVAIKYCSLTSSGEGRELARFEREARAIAALNHPHICQIFDVGPNYLVMEFVEGNPLRGALPMEIALQYGIQIAEALSAAHAKGIIHRDLKPGNILVTASGIKLLDFGIARLTASDDPQKTLARSGDLTRSGELIGTVVYMSPEQAQGETIDSRSDIFSFGALLYEMLSGQAAFAAKSAAQSLAAILRDEPPSIDTPPALQAIIHRCLRKMPAERYQSMPQVKDALLAASRLSESLLSPAIIRSQLERVVRSSGLRGSASLCRLLRYTVEAVLSKNEQNLKEYVIGLEVFDRGEQFDPGNDAIVRVQARKLREKLEAYYRTEGADDSIQIQFPKGGYVPSFVARKAAAVRTIAVLPFINLSPENDSSYFADGLTEELMHALIPVRELRVVARTSAFQFRNSSQDIRQIGRTLNAELLLEGSVRLAANQVRIAARLESAADGMQLWSGRYDRKLEEVFRVQDEIASAIAATVKQTVASLESPPAAQVPAQAASRADAETDLEAMKLYLKGRHFWNQRTASGFRKAAECFQQAIACQPRFSRAHAGLADVYVLMMMHNLERPGSLMPKAREAALAALEIDPASSQAHCSLAAVYALSDWNWAAADVGFQRSIEVDPNYATAYHWRGLMCDVPADRMDRALQNIEKAEQLDPLSLPIVSDHGWLLYYSRRYQEAETQYSAALEINPNFYRLHIFLGRLYAAQQQYEKAFVHLNRAFDSMDGDAFRSQALGTLGYLHGRLGNREEACKAATELEALGRRSFASPVDWAILSVGAGDWDAAFRHLTEAARQKAGFLVFLGHEPLLDDLRRDLRFHKLEEEILHRGR